MSADLERELADIRALLVALRADFQQFVRSRGPDAPEGAELLAAIFALLGDQEFTTAELLADASDESLGDEGRALRRSLARVGARWDDPRAGYRVGSCLRDLHRLGVLASGLRLLRPRAYNRRGVATWRVVRDVGPATSGTELP